MNQRVSRGRIISAIITAAILVGLVAGTILFVSQQDSLRARSGATARASATATATSGATAQFTPAPGVTVTVHATPTNSASGSTSSPSSTSPVTYTNGNGGRGITLPSGYPVTTPTDSSDSGGTGGASPTPTATEIATATPTPNPGTWYPGMTPTPTPTVVDNAQLMSYTPTGPISQNGTLTVNATYLNTGPSTWTSNYKFTCRQYCGTPWGGGGTFYPSLAPGQSFAFSGGSAFTYSSTYQVNTTIWQLWSPYNGYFGPQVKIEVINHGWYPDFQEASPDCSGSSVWSQHGTSGTVSCGGSGLALAGGGSNGVSLDLVSTPASYDPGNYLAKAHVHFNTTSASVFAGVIVTEPTATNSYRMVFVVSPAGYVCYETNTSFCLTTPVQTIPASSDYDLTVSVSNNGTADGMVVQPGEGFHGGISAGGLTGLIEVASPGVTDAAYFTNYQFYQYK